MTNDANPVLAGALDNEDTPGELLFHYDNIYIDTSLRRYFYACPIRVDGFSCSSGMFQPTI